MIKIWVDDERPIPSREYECLCDSVNETLFTIGRKYNAPRFNRKNKTFEEIMLDLDHDAGEYVADGGDYINILKALSQPWAGRWFGDGDLLKIRFHSMNPVGVKNMRAIVENCSWMEEV